ncbi:MAG: right-handed parallel beta-helix repeat-containing protein [Methanobrevibacter sp.]|uniref:right-handed parallel beta-helix repeat-containing protein n=1 Tax=Methanobrevibacter sp. TaxID=66852 RepID=UPI0026004826|nr:right-handed parallel beta-helix repeat-containing protein [Methanobrevibacter sp.]MBQ6099758.1 right-handed parallel beta-helix repeat-containing protein [Methanobrevibacter sp.]
MIKKINIFLVLLLVLISISAVSAADGNITELTSNKDIQDTMEVSVDKDISYGSSNLEDLASIENTSVIKSSSHTITESNYNQYFSSYDGKLVSSSVNPGDTIVLQGTFTDKSFVFEKQVNIVGDSTSLKNSMITLLTGASGSSIANLNIANTKDTTYGIFLNSANNCSIKDCTIKNTGMSSYCICVANGANYNNITGNDLTTYGITYGHGSFTRSTPTLILSGSHYNYIANNHVEADDANGIYLSSYSGGPLKGGNSNYNTIFNNTVHYNVLPTSWAYGIQVMGKNNIIDRNTVIGGYRGVSTADSGNTIINNYIINITGADYNHPGVETGGEYGIVASYNSYVANNTIIGSKIISTGAGITAIDNSIVENNWVNVTLKGRGIVGGGNNVIIRNNVIFTVSGSGIYQSGEDSGLIIDNNNITSDSGVGILIEKLSSKRMPKNVTVTNNVISTSNKYAIDVAGVQADTSNIDYKSNSIIGNGLVNSPAGVIDTSKPIYIFKGTTHTITPENIRKYINENGGLTSEISDDDILNFAGVFSNEVIYVTKAVRITGKNPIFYNSTFKVTSGGVLIENLTIINKAAERVNAWGIFINQASGVKVTNNKISVSDPKAAYAVYVLQSTDIDVSNNELTSQGDYLTFTLLSYACEDCSFENNVIKTIGTGQPYRFSPEKCIDGNELVINGRSYCLDGNELVIDGKSYCIDGNELVIDGQSYCLDGNEFVIDGTAYCIDGNEFVIDGTSYCLDGNELTIDGVSYQFKDNKLTINGTTYCLDGNEVTIGGNTYCLDGNEVTIDGKAYCLDGNELVIDGVHYQFNNKKLTVNGTSYCLDGNEVTIGGNTYCLDGNELVIDGKSYCLDGNELVIDGTRYCVDGNEYCMDGAHVVSEIYQTYGILLLYSSNNLIYGNDVNVTSKLESQQATKGNNSSQNSIVGIDIYFNSHNNTVSYNDVYLKANDNYIYGMGVLGYYTGHSAPVGQGATNNAFVGNQITIDGVYCVEGIIIGDESEDTFVEDNVLNLKSDAVVYGIYFEMSHKSTVKNNELNLNSQAIYGIEGYGSNNNTVLDNTVDANAKDVYGVIFLNGNDNIITGNKINANGNGEAIDTAILDSIKPGNAGIILMANSTGNYIADNEVKSTKGYAISLDDEAINNVIADNYLNSEKGVANKAVSNAKNNNVSDNYIYIADATAEDVSVKYRGTGEFKLVTDKKMDGAIVKFYDLDGKYLVQSTVSNGLAVAKYKFDASYTPSQYLFTAKIFKEDYKASSFDINVFVSKSNMKINVAAVSIGQGDKGNVVAKVLDEFGNPISGVSVTFKRINSAGRAVTMGSAKTNSNGVATLSYSVGASLNKGTYSMTAEVANQDNYNGAKITSKLTVKEKISFVGAKNYNVYYGNTVTYKIQIKDANTKKPLSGKSVTFKINGKSKTVKTNKNGYASYSVKLAAGSYTITASCNGYSSSKKITFKPTLTAKDISKKKSKTTKFTVKLVDKNGKILKNKKITFKFKNKKYTAKTNNKGIATLSLNNIAVGKYPITSSYGGCTIKNTITIKK